MDKVYNNLQDEKVQLISDLRVMSKVEILICVALLILSTLIFKVKISAIISTIGLIASTASFIVTSYFYKKWISK